MPKNCLVKTLARKHVKITEELRQGCMVNFHIHRRRRCPIPNIHDVLELLQLIVGKRYCKRKWYQQTACHAVCFEWCNRTSEVSDRMPLSYSLVRLTWSQSLLSIHCLVDSVSSRHCTYATTLRTHIHLHN